MSTVVTYFDVILYVFPIYVYKTEQTLIKHIMKYNANQLSKERLEFTI